MAEKMKYCSKCGNRGFRLDGSKCDCQVNMEAVYESVSCLEIPKQYQGVQFTSSLVPKDLGDAYPAFLQEIHDDILLGKLPTKNILIASPVAHSKTILAYSCIEVMFRSNFPVFPIFDVLEIVRTLTDMDLGRKPTYDIEEPARLLTVPLLFVKIPRMLRWEMFDAVVMLLDRRVRRGNATIFLYDGSWAQLQAADKGGVVTGLQGNGTYSSLLVKSWSLTSQVQDIQLQSNIG